MRLGPRWTRQVSAVRFQVRTRTLDMLWVGRTYVARKPVYEPNRITPQTRLVMDGFPRSANSYAKWAFQYAQGDGGLSLAGHAHSADLLRAAVRAGLPTVVLIREPGAAAASVAQMGVEYGRDVASWLHAYARFHERLLPVREELLVVHFDDVVSDFGGVIDRINARFGTEFHGYARTEDDEAEVARLVEEANRRRSGGVVDEQSVSRPSEGRRHREDMLAAAGPRATRALARATRAYRASLDPAG